MILPAKPFKAILSKFGYSRHDVNVYAATNVRLTGLRWDDDLFSVYNMFRVGMEYPCRYASIMAIEVYAEGEIITMKQGQQIIVKHGTIRGKDVIACIYVNPLDMPKFIGEINDQAKMD